ncbi:MAG: hypothetical protein Q7U91_05290 [Sideroxyarcus sp.]|nr:hypothetical protein [Sideroxyarcus sp.]
MAAKLDVSPLMIVADAGVTAMLVGVEAVDGLEYPSPHPPMDHADNTSRPIPSQFV